MEKNEQRVYIAGGARVKEIYYLPTIYYIRRSFQFVSYLTVQLTAPHPHPVLGSARSLLTPQPPLGQYIYIYNICMYRKKLIVGHKRDYIIVISLNV